MFSVVIYTTPAAMARATAAIALSLGMAACSMPMSKFSFTETTGSIIPSLSRTTAVEAPYLVSFVGSDAWPSLKTALITALIDREDGERVNWKGGNVQSGTVTPIATTTAGDGRRCRRVAITRAIAPRRRRSPFRSLPDRRQRLVRHAAVNRLSSA